MFTLKLYGTIALDFGSKDLSLDLTFNTTTLKELLKSLKTKNEQSFVNYFDADFSPKRGTLILINGVDFNTLEGLETNLTLTDQVSLIPTISGG